jgi:phosphomevalonate kinase
LEPSSKKAKVIGLVAKAGSGKDTVFNIIKTLLPHRRVVRLAFGDEVKAEVAERHEVSVEAIEDNKEAYRNLLQKWGTEYRRKQEEKYWIKKIKTQLDILRVDSDIVVITDVRFLNEADFIRDNCKGVIIKITGDKARVLDSSHTSEMEMQYIKPDWLLPNTGSLQQLAEGVAFLLHDLNIEDLNDDTHE